MCSGKGCLHMAYFFFTASLLLFTSCVVLHFYIDQLFISFIKKSMILAPDSAIFDAWSNDRTPTITYLYLYDLKNAQSVIQGSKPVFEEAGPYSYQKSPTRWNFSFSNEANPKYLRYNMKSTYYPYGNLSQSDINQRQITSLDLFAAGLVLQDKAFYNEWIYRTTEPFVTKPANEIIWGYTHDNIKACNRLTMCPEKLSIFSKENDSLVEEFLIKTGADDINEVGRVLEYNNKKEFDAWDSKYANMINGSDGGFMGFDLSVGAQKHIFVPGVCRSVVMEATKLIPHPMYPELQVLAFEPAEPELNSTIYPPPSEFCQGRDYEPKCAPEGLVSFSPCLKDDGYLPVYGSQGHFYGASPDIKNQFKGIREPDDDDRTVMYVEPLTGITLGASQSMQINFYIDNEKRPSMPFGSMGGPYFFPIIRIVNKVYPSVETLSTMHKMIYGLKYWMHLAVYASSIFSLLVILITTTIIIRQARLSRKCHKTVKAYHQTETLSDEYS